MGHRVMEVVDTVRDMVKATAIGMVTTAAGSSYLFAPFLSTFIHPRKKLRKKKVPWLCGSFL